MTTTTHSNKKGQRLTMLQFYKLIIAEWAPKLVAFNRLISNVDISAKGLQQMIKKRERLFHKNETEAAAAVNAVSDEITFAISNRMKGFQINFESQLLLMYFTKLIFVLGLGDGFDASRVTATNVLSDLFEQLDEVISKQHGEVAWKDVPIGQLGFLRSKHQRYKIAINGLFLALDFRLQKAMAGIDSETRAKDRAKLPEKALKIMQDYAKHDAKVILKTLGKKKNRTIKVEAILQYIIKPLAKNIFIPSETVPQYKKIPEMSLAQLIILRTHLTQTKSALDNLGRAIHSPNRSRTKSLTTRMKFLASHNKMTTLHLTYDPKTQRGMVLCLRARLGQHFELRFHPIGANGKRKRGAKQRDLNPRDSKKQKEEEEEEEPITILSFPVELIYYITGFMVKAHPTPEETKGLFAFARSTSELRFYIEDPGLENVISRKFLGTQHTRNREERRLGLEPHVAQRYKAVFKLLGFKDKNIKALQDKADRNIQTYKIEVEKRKKAEAAKEPREKEWTIRSWPWWYFRALSNQRSLENITNQFRDGESDALFMSEVSVVAFQLYQRATRWVPGAPQGRWVRFNDSVSEYDMDYLLQIGRDVYDEPGLWQIWTSGADLMVIPIDTLVQRALTYSYNIGRKMRLNGPTRLTISVSEPMPVSKPRRGLASFRKEVIMTGLTELPDTLSRHTQSQGKAEIIDFDLKLVLQIQQAYLGKKWSQFLGPQRKPLPYLHLESLSLQQVHFENPLAPLDLSALTGNFLSELRFGPSNVRHVPKLFCPSPFLEKLRLVTQKKPTSVLLWNLEGKNPASCFPKLDKLYIDGNVRIWESPVVLKIPNFPNLYVITLDHFPGTFEDLKRLGRALEQAPRSTTWAPGNYPGGITVWVRFIGSDPISYLRPNSSPFSVETAYFNFNGVRFRNFHGSNESP